MTEAELNRKVVQSLKATAALLSTVQEAIVNLQDLQRELQTRQMQMQRLAQWVEQGRLGVSDGAIQPDPDGGDPPEPA